MRKILKILLFSIVILIISLEVDAKYIYKNEESIFKIKGADNEKPIINNRNYNVYDEAFSEDVKIDFSDNIGVSLSQYCFKENENMEDEWIDFNSGVVFENSGYYKIKVVDLYKNIVEYFFMLDKEVNKSEINIVLEDNSQSVVEIVAEDILSGIQKIEVYVDNKLYTVYNYADDELKQVSKEMVFPLEEIDFYEEIYVITYDKLGNLKKSESIILNVDKIYDVVDLYRFCDIVNNKKCDFLGKSVYLMKSLELNLLKDNNWRAISGFKGEFDGKKRTISGFYMDKTTEKTAFFADNYGVIKNLTISGEIKTSGDISGGICAENYGEIINCRSRVKINSSGNYIGGISGINYGAIKQSRNNSHITTTGKYVGGIVGYNKSLGKIYKCGSSGKMTGEMYIGGVCGFTEGNNNNVIELSFNMGNIAGSEFVGGICGGTSDGIINMKSLYNRGNVIENNGVGNNGGIIGCNKKNINICNGYNLGEINSLFPNQIGPQNIKVDNFYYIKNKANASGIGIAKNEALFKEVIENENSILFLLNQKVAGVWIIKYGHNDGYPMFVWQFE